ncbi:MAG: UdgX family uracil-DNA binding protein [Pseudomonadota bacterium]
MRSARALAQQAQQADDLFARGEDAPLRTVLLPSADLAAFRQAARALLDQDVEPARVSWHIADSACPDLFADSAVIDSSAGLQGGASPLRHPAATATATVTVPADFLALCESVILHRDPGRFGLLYRLLWRLQREPDLRHDPLDADRVLAGQMAQAVRRDMHKMKAFVRFRTVEDDQFRRRPEEGPLHVAWFEPEHHIVQAVAPFFARRFTQMRWVILTPEASVRSVSRIRNVKEAGAHEVVQAAEPTGPEGFPSLEFGPGAKREEAPPADAGEKLWLTYYQSIFNPARLKLRMMQQEMPRRYWKNLPEAQFISELSAAASARSQAMVAQSPTLPLRRIRAIEPTGEAAERQRADAMHGPASSAAAASSGPLRLDELKSATDRCRECPIGMAATQSVVGEGPAHARLMLVGEQPGDQEDLRGRPFVGPAGRLLDQAISQLGWKRDALYVTNAVKHFKYELRGKRRMHKTPTQQEAAACLHWLETEIALVKPKAAVALGATAARSLLGRHVAVMSERGQWFERSDGLRVLITLHPSALLRGDPAQREEAFAAWLSDLRHASAIAGAA